MKNLLYLLLAATLLGGCRTYARLLDKGDYDTVITRAIRQLSGKPKKEKYVAPLEEAFERATKQDMASIESLRKDNTARSWEEILRITTRIDRRQDRLRPLLPLYTREGRQAEFLFARTEPIIREARTQAETLYQAKLDDLTIQARAGNRAAAREGWRLIEQIRALNPDNDQRALRDELRELGTTDILLTMDNESRSILPAGIIRELLSTDIGRSSDGWQRYHIISAEGAPVDYMARLTVTAVNMTPERWREESKNYAQRIKDGWEYVLDDRGNVKKDSLGNDIKRDKYIEVKATVVETLQEKAANVLARVEITDLATDRVIVSRPIAYEERFHHVARNFYGDERALDNHLRQRVQPAPYPSDTEMITAALFGLKPVFMQQVRQANYQ